MWIEVIGTNKNVTFRAVVFFETGTFIRENAPTRAGAVVQQATIRCPTVLTLPAFVAFASLVLGAFSVTRAVVEMDARILRAVVAREVFETLTCVWLDTDAV